MSKLCFFSIPAHGHTNPTLPLIKELVERGHDVTYYSYNQFKSKIELTGAHFESCDLYDSQIHLTKEDIQKISKDVDFSIELLVKTSLAMHQGLLQKISNNKPDVIIGDSMAPWAKFIAHKLEIPYICSTTTFAFNKHSAKVMKQDLSSALSLLMGLPKIKRSINKLKKAGYPVNSFLELISNDELTDTIIYTSTYFQPYAETFNEHYCFAGPCIFEKDIEIIPHHSPLVYVSLGTVNNQYSQFYQNCIDAFAGKEMDVILNIGKETDPSLFKNIPDNINIVQNINQLNVLKQCDVFLTHCGMNSVSEALYYEVPLLLFPQTSEQAGVANRVEELHAGIKLNNIRPQHIYDSICTLLNIKTYKQNTSKIAQSFKDAGGYKTAADFIEKRLKYYNNIDIHY